MHYIQALINDLFTAVSAFYSDPWQVGILLAFLVVATVSDMRHRKIYNWTNGGLVVAWVVLSVLTGFEWTDLVAGFTGFVALLIPAMVKYQKMGGDIKAAGAIGLFLGLPLTLLFLLCTGVSFILYVLVSKAVGIPLKMLPMAPFFSFAFLLLYALSLMI